MLSKLSISNYILIDSLEISFPGGLGIITGQTGAGKSILLGALSLLTGAKADASMISEGADSCVVEGEFSLPNGSLRPLLEENEVEWDGGELIIRRVLNRSGRTRSFINDSPVPLGVLSEVGKQLVDIHSQHQTALLADSRFQLSVLDYFAGNDALLKECSDAWKLLITRQKELSEAEERLSKLSSERDYVQARYKTLNDAGLREGELAELEEEQKKACQRRIYQRSPARGAKYLFARGRYECGCFAEGSGATARKGFGLYSFAWGFAPEAALA